MINIVLTNFAQIMIVDYTSKRIFDTKCKKNKRIIIILAGIILLTLFNFFGPNIYGSIVYLLIIFAMIYFSSIVTIVDATMVSVLQFINVSIGEFISMLIFSAFAGLDKDTDVLTLPYTFALIFSLFITFLLSHLTIKFLEVKKKYGFRYNQLILVLPFITSLLILNIKDYFLMVRNYPVIILILIGLMCSNFIMLFLFFQSIRSIRLETELEISQNRINLSKNHIKLLDEQYENNFNYIHSLLHDIHQINESYQIKELDDMAKKIDMHFNSMLTNSLSLTAVINRNISSIDRNKIKVRTTIYEPFMNIDFEKQILFFEELIKTGIDNCINSQEKDRILIFQIKRINHLLVIRFVTPNQGYRINKNVCSYLSNNEITEFNEIFDEKLATITYLFMISE